MTPSAVAPSLRRLQLVLPHVRAERLSPLSTGARVCVCVCVCVQIRTNPFPHLLVDVRDASAAAARPLPAEMADAVQLPGAPYSTQCI
jgi:hypothetical protein